MTAAATPVEAVAAWIDGRLDLGLDEEAFSSPEMVSPSYGAILEPLIEQLQRGLELGVFNDIVPVTAAESIHGVVWAGTQRQWAINNWDREVVRERALRFCLHGLGVAKETIEQITANDERAALAWPD
jgi:hypothetical protein